MSSLNGRKVKVARLHVATHAIGIGSIGPGVEPSLGRTLGLAELTVAEGGLLIKVGKIEHYVPAGNIVGMTLEPETK